ncbi:MAG: LUD domain-containing protein [Bacillota bacterium]
MKTYRAKLNRRIENGFRDVAAGQFRALMKIGLKMRSMACVSKWPGLSDQVRGIKEKSTAGLENLLRQAVERMEENGFRVFRAKTDREALDFIKDLVTPGLVIKSKSNAVKEIGLVPELEAKGCRVLETDLGDRICQLGNITPAHPIGPAIHVPVDRVAEIFSRELGESLPASPPEIVKAVRRSLRQDFLRMDFGISGANAIAADTGSLVLTENEGNIRMITSLAPVHIVVAGIEKIVPTLEDAIKVVQAAAVYGVGQDTGTYITIMTAPPGIDPAEGIPGSAGPAEIYVVLLEQGRWEARQKKYEETLYCLNCGSCLADCPVYVEIGEHYGSKYVGGIGVLLTHFRESHQKALECGLALCMSCMSCTENCPAKIKTPRYILKLRREAGVGRRPLVRKILLGRLKSAPQGEGAAIFLKVGERCLGKKSDTGPGWKLKRPVAGIDCRRLIPAVAGKPFLAGHTGFSLPGGKARVAFFAGCLINLFCNEIGTSTLNLLRRLGVEVVMPRRQLCCSRPNLAEGDWENALAMITSNIELFEREKVDAVVTACATCGSTLKEYPDLLKEYSGWHGRAVNFSEKVRDIAAFLAGLPKIKELPGEYASRVTYHDPCHLARGQGVREEPRSLLGRIAGLNLAEMMDPGGCCGFGGSVSVDFYSISSRVGSRKAMSIAQTGADTVVTGCPGCIIHLRDVLQREGRALNVMHTVQVLDKAFAGSR